ncbi:4-hydroxyphenylacetaldehyde oxime monooxygenase-like [Miscanthus floridulus]|uniref:4-hydroxyphenylacetaldehyde oxime monooxygenase-like n=1 Tax=Miscanthus floridulus TaxID=154761 RepID=UPI00345A9DCE
MAELPLHYSYYLLLLIPLLAPIPLLGLHHSAARRRRSGAAPLPPPSPRALPVVGHLHHLALASALPHRAMRDLARPLGGGPLMLLRLGELRVVVASSADAAREVMRIPGTDTRRAHAAPERGRAGPAARPVRERATSALRRRAQTDHHRRFAYRGERGCFFAYPSVGRQNGSCVWVSRWRAFLVGKTTVEDVFWVCISLLETV